MSNKIVDLDALSEYKTNADLKYQDKLTADANITLNNNVISVTPPYMPLKTSGSSSVTSGSRTNIGGITLAPGNYILTLTCQFSSNPNGYRQCGFSTGKYLDNLGAGYYDSRKAVSGALTQTMVSALFQVSATTYPDGRTFNFIVNQNSGSTLTVYPRCYCLKF